MISSTYLSLALSYGKVLPLGPIGINSIRATARMTNSDKKTVLDRRDLDAARAFMQTLCSRLAARVQMMLVKIYTDAMENRMETRYSGGVCCGAQRRRKIGYPARDKISTAYAERQNLTMRMGMRRFTRLTNGFSKKVANLHNAVALHLGVAPLV